MEGQEEPRVGKYLTPVVNKINVTKDGIISNFEARQEVYATEVAKEGVPSNRKACNRSMTGQDGRPKKLTVR